MKTRNHTSSGRAAAFTLIELLVVMAVLGVLAALIFPVAAHIKRRAAVTRVQTQLKSIEAAIETYKANVQVYPPDNPGNFALNPLFYELAGLSPAAGGGFTTGSGVTILNPTAFFGSGVTGFINVTKGSDDEQQAAKNCLSNIKPSQYAEVNGPNGLGTVLGVSDIGPFMFTNNATLKTINPWRYTTSGATNNPGSYDLWVDVLISGKTNRISNWSDKPILVYY